MTQNPEESPIHGEVTHLNPETLEAVIGLLIEVSLIATFTQRFFGR